LVQIPFLVFDSNSPNVLKDEPIELGGQGTKHKCPYLLRLIADPNPARNEIYMFLNSNMDLRITPTAKICVRQPSRAGHDFPTLQAQIDAYKISIS
jgi:hypothetical protein